MLCRAVRKECGISVQLAQTGDEPINAIGNLFGHLTLRTTVPINIPVWPLIVDIRRTLSFVITIVPFDKISFHFRNFIQTDQLTGLQYALERTAQDICKGDASEALAKFTRLALSVVGQLNIRATSVPTGE